MPATARPHRPSTRHDSMRPSARRRPRSLRERAGRAAATAAVLRSLASCAAEERLAPWQCVEVQMMLVRVEIEKPRSAAWMRGWSRIADEVTALIVVHEACGSTPQVRAVAEAARGITNTFPRIEAHR